MFLNDLCYWLVLASMQDVKMSHQIINGSLYCEGTPDTLIKVLESLIITEEKVTITCGNISTGKAWADGTASGYVAKSSKSEEPPVFLMSKRSQTATYLHTDSIIKITAKGGRVVYQGPIN